MASELHASCGPLFGPASDEVKAYLLARVEKKYSTLNDLLLKDKSFLVGNDFTVADSYAYIVISWAGYLGLDMTKFPVVQAYFERVKALPNVAAAHARMAESPKTVVQKLQSYRPPASDPPGISV